MIDYTRVSAEMCQLRKISHMRDDNEKVEEERKKDLRRKMREFITHFTER